MNRPTTILAILCALLAPVYAAPMSDRCTQVEPVCPPATHALCVCESDISMRCGYICVGT